MTNRNSGEKNHGNLGQIFRRGKQTQMKRYQQINIYKLHVIGYEKNIFEYRKSFKKVLNLLYH